MRKIRDAVGDLPDARLEVVAQPVIRDQRVERVEGFALVGVRQRIMAIEHPVEHIGMRAVLGIETTGEQGAGVLAHLLAVSDDVGGHPLGQRRDHPDVVEHPPRIHRGDGARCEFFPPPGELGDLLIDVADVLAGIRVDRHSDVRQP